MNLSDEERERRSENMRQLHAAGKAGGSQFGQLGGRPRKRRVSELIAEKAQADAEVIWIKLKDLMDDESSKIRLEAIKQVISIEDAERKIQVEEEVRYEQLKHADLAELVIQNLFELVRGGQIDLAEIIDAEVVEERAAIGSGESDGRLEEETEGDWSAE